MAVRFKVVRNVAQKLSSHLMIALVIVGLLVFMALFLYQSLQIQSMQAKYNDTRHNLALSQENTNLLQEHLDFYKGPGYLLYVEKVAREALNMVKPGETVVLAVQPGGRSAVVGQPADTASPQTGAITNQTAPQKPKSNWQNWLTFFIGQ